MDFNSVLVLLMFLVFIAMLWSGYPIAFVLGGVAMIFTLVGFLSDLWFDTTTGLDYMMVGMIVNRIYKLMDNWVLIAVPMFIFMGLMLDRSGIAGILMNRMQDLFGPIRGGMAITVSLIGVILAAATGIIGASVVLLGLLTVPAMLRQGYSKSLATGTVCAAGTLGILIPPSIMLVIMGDQLGLSVGDLFMGAVFPGFILVTLFILYILIYSYLKPEAAPLAIDRPPVKLNMVWHVIATILPVVCLIFAVLGSIFMGIATVTEASGVGALGATLLALFNKKLNWKVIKNVVHETFNTTGFIFGIFIGATCFALVLRGLGGDETIGALLGAIPFGDYGIIVVILLLVFALGFFLDWIEITLIILPLIAPVISSLDLKVEGYGVVDNPELVWFTVLVAVSLQTSFLTPPVGFALFYLKGVSPPEIELLDIYKGVIPFIVLQLMGLLAVVFWPQLVIWLPYIAYR